MCLSSQLDLLKTRFFPWPWPDGVLVVFSSLKSATPVYYNSYSPVNSGIINRKKRVIGTCGLTLPSAPSILPPGKPFTPLNVTLLKVTQTLIYFPSSAFKA